MQRRIRSLKAWTLASTTTYDGWITAWFESSRTCTEDGVNDAVCISNAGPPARMLVCAGRRGAQSSDGPGEIARGHAQLRLGASQRKPCTKSIGAASNGPLPQPIRVSMSLTIVFAS